MPTLIFGVLDVAYSDAHTIGDTAKTTGDVAEILEDRYHVMQTFYDLRKGRIAEFLADGMAIQIQDMLSGRAKLGSSLYDVTQKIEREFRTFLDANEMQKLALALWGSAVSAAALKGVNHRKKHPYANKNKSRVAFVDTGLYRQSFRASISGL